MFSLLCTPSKAQTTNVQSLLHPSNAMQMQFGICKAIVPAISFSSLHELKDHRMLSVPANNIHSKSPLYYLPSLTS